MYPAAMLPAESAASLRASATPRTWAARASRAWTRALSESYLGSHVALATATSMLMGALGLISGPLLARLLGPEARGELAAIQAWPLLLVTISTLGLHESTIYFAARNPRRAGQYLASAGVLSVATSAAVAATGYALMPLLLHAQAAGTVATARWYLLVVPLLALVSMPMGALRGRKDLVVWNLLRIGMPIGWIVVLALAAITGHNHPAWIAGAYLVVLGVMAATAWGVSRRRMPGPFIPDRRDWRAMLRYGLPTMASQTPMLLNLRFDQMLMAALLLRRELGLYAVAVAWGSALSPMMSGIGVVMFPAVAAASSGRDQARILSQGTRLSVLLALGIGLVLLLLAPAAIPFLFGTAFAGATAAAMILVPAGVVAELNGILREGARGLGATKAVLMSEIVGVLAGVALLAVLLGPLGIVGAALASLVGYSAASLMLVTAVGRATGSSIASLLLPRPDDVRALWRRAAKVTGRQQGNPAPPAPRDQDQRHPVLFLCPTQFSVRNVLHSRMLTALQDRGHRAFVLGAPAVGAAGNAGYDGAAIEAPRRRLLAPVLSALDVVQRASFFRRFNLCSDRVTRPWYGRHDGPWRRAAAALMELAAVPGSRAPFYGWQLACLGQAKRAAWDLSAARRTLATLQPSVVVATSCISQDEEPYLHAAREFGIPTLGCIQSFDHLTSRPLPAKCDHYAVWNERMKRQLLEYHGPYSPARITVTGTAQFDFHRQPEFRWTRAETLQRIGLAPGDRYILYAANTITQTPSEPTLVLDLAARCARIPELADHRIVVRLHPRDDFGRWDRVAQAGPRVVVSRPTAATQLFEGPHDQARLVSTLSHADVCHNMWSSMSLDAAALDIPVVCVAFAGSRGGLEEEFCRRVYETEYYRPIVESGGVRVARDLDQLVAETVAYVLDRSRDALARARLAAEECGPLDGRSAERIAGLIDGIAAATPPAPPPG
jgi:O-antigen/teichoic acid export membrane protein